MDNIQTKLFKHGRSGDCRQKQTAPLDQNERVVRGYAGLLRFQSQSVYEGRNDLRLARVGDNRDEA